MNKKLLTYMFMFVVLSISVLGACTYSTYEDGSDYFGISSSYVNTTLINSNQKWIDWAFFTPRLNFTRNVTDFFYGANKGSYSYFSWKTPLNFSSTLTVKNGSNVVSPTNYSLINISATTWVLNWSDGRYNTTLLNVSFNRTFIKNVDDIVLAPENIYLGATRSSFLVESTPVAYGDDKEFQFTLPSPGQLGEFINVSNWAVGWDVTNQTCTLGDDGCSAGASSIWGLLAMIVVAGFLLYLVGVFFEGSVTISIIVLVTIVAMLIPWLISILNGGC